MSVSRPTLIAVLLLVALAAFGLAWTHMDLNRSGDMRASEEAFYDGLETKPRAAGAFAADAGAPAPQRRGRAEKPAQSDAALDAWYAESGSAPAETAEADPAAGGEEAAAAPAA